MIDNSETKPAEVEEQKEAQKTEAEIDEVKKKEMELKEKQDKVKRLKEKLKKRESEIKLLKQDNEKLKDRFLRALAEMENLKKRVEREKSEFYQYALSDFLKELFTVLDNLERALQSPDQSNGKSFRDGIELIYKQYLDLLLKQGVTPIEIKDKKFDPNLHQALITVESEDVHEPQVVEEIQKGYTLYNRVLRPALVKVSIPKKSE
jgi:molecular chaperone GrpE